MYLNSKNYMNGQNLNESRFLVEEVNIDDEPTEQEIFDRAEQLEIDDLYLAKESLTKQLGPEWKPYCNRKKNIYYINLKERRAYVDHPIDMEYKIKYAKKNNLLLPRFPSVKVQEIATSMHLIEEQIQKYKQLDRTDLHLNIVYEEPSEEDQSSKRQPSQPSERPQQLNTQDLEEFLKFKKQLENQYEAMLQVDRKENQRKLQQLERQHEETVEKIQKKTLRQFQEAYQKEVRLKNDIDIKKQKQKVETQFFTRKGQFLQNALQYQELHQSLEEKRANLETLIREKKEYHIFSQYQDQLQSQHIQRNHLLNNLIHELKEQFLTNMNRMVGGSKFYQSLLTQELNSLFPAERRRRKSIFQKKQIPMERKPIEYNYAAMENQIKHDEIWTKYSTVGEVKKSHRPSLNLRLRMRVI